jgi:methionyl-tRNA synthetase
LSARYPDDGGLFQRGAEAGAAIAQAYESGDYNRAMRLIIELADQANPFVESQAPWTLRDQPDRLRDVCTVALNLFRQLAIYLAPVLPELARQAAQLLGEPIVQWEQSQSPLLATAVRPFQHMLQRVDRKKVDAMIEASKDEPQPTEPSTGAPAETDAFLRAEPIGDAISIDQFAQVDLRVARVLTAEEVPDARKLLKLTVSLGGDERRTVFAWIKQAYDPKQLQGRLVILAANLAPRQMKFGTSEGMILAAGPGGSDVFLLSVDSGAQPGQRVH